MLDETHLPGAVFPFADDRARCQRAAQSRGRVDRATSAFVVDYSSCAPWNFSRFLRQPMPDYVPDSARMSADWTRCGVANMQEHRGSADAACLEALTLQRIDASTRRGVNASTYQRVDLSTRRR